MKKLPKYISTLVLTMGVWGAFLVPIALAQTSFLLVSQGQSPLQSPTMCAGGGCFDYKIGTGWVGTTTSAIMVASTSPSQSNIWTTAIFGYSDPTYTTLVQHCVYQSNSEVGVAGRVQKQLLNQSVFTGDCVLYGNRYYDLEFEINTAWDPYGTDSNTHPGWTLTSSAGSNFYPSFSIIGNGFQLSPSISSSGINFSAAQQFCNGAFGTSTGGAYGIITDSANSICQVGAYLFVPSTDSVDTFTQIPTSLEGKFPFSWGFGVKDLLTNLTASTSANYPTVTYNFSTSTGLSVILSSSSLLIVNPTLIQNLAPDSTWTTIRYLMASILWIAFAYFVYRKVLGIWHAKV